MMVHEIAHVLRKELKMEKPEDFEEAESEEELDELDTSFESKATEDYAQGNASLLFTRRPVADDPGWRHCSISLRLLF